MEPPTELTTVADDEAVVHRGLAVRGYTELRPGTAYRYDGLDFRTLPALGERLCTLATVNDVHFGETVCGQIAGSDTGPVFRSEPGEPPYPETMNRAAVEEIEACGPDLVVAKGDLTGSGLQAEYQAFLDCYQGTFGDRLLHVRGNHDAYHQQAVLPEAPLARTLPGVTVALLDTTWPGHAGGRLTADDLAWLDTLATDHDRPVLVFGHHPVGDHTPSNIDGESFVLQPRDGLALREVFARRPRLRGYFAGHTHRNRVRRFEDTADVPFVEVACVKDFPGSWAEYRIYERGILQVHRRISSPEALAWSERTRAMFRGRYAAYAFGELADRCFALG